VTWINYYGAASTFTYPCSGTHTYYGESIIHVSNGCGNRVWLHGTTTGGGASYCVNPGALAYGFTTIYEQILVSAAGAACDAGVQAKVEWTDYSVTQAACVDGATYTDYSVVGGTYQGVLNLNNLCNVRIWIHENPNGSGDAWCVSPGAFVSPNVNVPDTQIYISGNQAPCSAG